MAENYPKIEDMLTQLRDIATVEDVQQFNSKIRPLHGSLAQRRGVRPLAVILASAFAAERTMPAKNYIPALSSGLSEAAEQSGATESAYKDASGYSTLSQSIISKLNAEETKAISSNVTMKEKGRELSRKWNPTTGAGPKQERQLQREKDAASNSYNRAEQEYFTHCRNINEPCGVTDFEDFVGELEDSFTDYFGNVQSTLGEVEGTIDKVIADLEKRWQLELANLTHINQRETRRIQQKLSQSYVPATVEEQAAKFVDDGEIAKERERFIMQVRMLCEIDPTFRPVEPVEYNPGKIKPVQSAVFANDLLAVMASMISPELKASVDGLGKMLKMMENNADCLLALYVDGNLRKFYSVLSHAKNKIYPDYLEQEKRATQLEAEIGYLEQRKTDIDGRLATANGRHRSMVSDNSIQAFFRQFSSTPNDNVDHVSRYANARRNLVSSAQQRAFLQGQSDAVGAMLNIANAAYDASLQTKNLLEARYHAFVSVAINDVAGRYETNARVVSAETQRIISDTYRIISPRPNAPDAPDSLPR
jgi:hypothetical protein